MATNFKKVVSFFKTTLAQGMSASQTTMTLNASPAGNVEYPNWLVIEPNSANEELVYCPTSPVANAFSGVVRDIDAMLDLDTAGAGKAHAGNVDVIMAPVHRQHNSIVEVLTGVSALPAVPKLPAARTISDVRHLVDKEYADAMVASGYTAFYVTQNGAAPSLTVNVAAGEYVKVDGSLDYFVGAAAQVVLANNTNYVEMDGAGTVSVNQVGFTSGSFALAVVIAGAATISSISDRRCLMGQNDGSVDKIRTWATAQTIPANKLLINSDAATGNEAVRKDFLDASITNAVNALRFVDKLNITTANAAFSNSVAENTLFSLSIPGGTLGTNNGVRARIYLTFGSNAVTDTHTFRFKYGGTTVGTVICKPKSAGNSNFVVIELVLLGNAATNAQEGTIFSAADSDNDSVFNRLAHGTAAEDSTAAKNLILTGQMSAASANEAETMVHAVVEVIQ